MYLFLLLGSAHANDYIVDDLGDLGDCDTGDGVCDASSIVGFECIPTGTCTLRAALEQAAADPGPHLVTFSAGAFGTIRSDNLIVPSGTFVDGTMPDGSRAHLSGTDGMVMFGSDIAVMNMEISSFTGNALVISGSDNFVQGNLIRSNDGPAISVQGSRNLIGGSTAISGEFPGNELTFNEGLFGIGVHLTLGSDNDVQGNLITLNEAQGILVEFAGNRIGGATDDLRNEIRLNIGPGIQVQDETVIEGNHIESNFEGIHFDGGSGTRVGGLPAIGFADPSCPPPCNRITDNIHAGISDDFGYATATEIIGNVLGEPGVPNLYGVDGHCGGGRIAHNIIRSNEREGINVFDACTIEDNYVGTSPFGGLNANGGTGVAAHSDGVVKNNVIAGQSQQILIGDGGRVLGNLVGSSETGDFGGGVVGIRGFGSDVAIGGLLDEESNIVVDASGAGIFVNEGSLVQIVGNQVGATAADAQFVRGNGVGIHILATVDADIAFNTVAAGTSGILVEGGVANVVRDNDIGANGNGDPGLGNSGVGIVLDVTGEVLIDSNLLVDNGEGAILLLDASDVEISSNDIGSEGGACRGANGGDAIRVEDPSIRVQITDNEIGCSSGDAVAVVGGSQVRIVENDIHQPGQRPIALGDGDTVANDPLDADGGANGLQNAAEIEAAAIFAGGTCMMGGLLQAAPNEAFEIHVYGDDSSADPRELRQSFTVNTDADGAAHFCTEIVPCVENFPVSITTTDSEDNTSEFRSARADRSDDGSDVDGDGVPDAEDNCPLNSNADQEDVCNGGCGGGGSAALAVSGKKSRDKNVEEGDAMAMLELTVTAVVGDSSVSSLTLEASGSGDDKRDVSGVTVLDGGGNAIGSGSFERDDGDLQLQFDPIAIPEGGQAKLTLQYEFANRQAAIVPMMPLLSLAACGGKAGGQGDFAFEVVELNGGISAEGLPVESAVATLK